MLRILIRNDNRENLIFEKKISAENSFLKNFLLFLTKSLSDEKFLYIKD